MYAIRKFDPTLLPVARTIAIYKNSDILLVFPKS